MTIEDYLTPEKMQLFQEVTPEFTKEQKDTVKAACSSKAVCTLLAEEVKATPNLYDILTKLPKIFAMGFYYGQKFNELKQLEDLYSIKTGE